MAMMRARRQRSPTILEIEPKAKQLHASFDGSQSPLSPPHSTHGADLDLYSRLIHGTRYARRMTDALGERRETWAETCDRTINALCKGVTSIDPATKAWLYTSMHSRSVMPSMRVVMTAGPALDRDNVCAYNCSYVVLDRVESFREILYVLSRGSGVGFSCEKRYISKLPSVAQGITETEEKLRVPDSAEGWAMSFHKYITHLWAGEALTVDVSRVRGAGARLKTTGGRASGPEPLVRLFGFAKTLFTKAVGRQLSSLEVHDLVCMVASCIVSGGVRRSSLISLSDLDDPEMRDAKSGEWWTDHPHRSCANNSAVYEGRPDEDTFWTEWDSLVKSKAGERGIFNRSAAQKQASKYGKRSATAEYGINPCGEILLKPRQFCNLSEVIARWDDTVETLVEKARVAAVFGTLQARLTNFNEDILSPEWRQNVEEERLLGVSITGVMDSALLSEISQLRETGLLGRLRQAVIDTNAEWAARIGIPASAATTCVKPSGTVSQLCGTSSGIHARWSDHYIRRVRLDQHDPAVKFMQAEIPSLDFEKDLLNTTQVVFSYPMKAPARSVITTSVNKGHGHRTMTPLQQLELWLEYSRDYCDHNPSISVFVTDRLDKWFEVGTWVWRNFDLLCGLAFFPSNLGTYKQAPQEAITKDKYEELIAKIPSLDSINWDRLSEFERKADEAQLDSTHRETMSCTGGACEL